MSNTKLKKIGKIVTNVLLYFFLAVAVFAVILTLFSKKDDDGTAEIFGYQVRLVTSDSMGACEYTDVSSYDIKSIPVRSLIFVKAMPSDPALHDEWYRSLDEGDVLTFRYVYTTQVTITHRIVSIKEKDTGGFVIELAGDNKSSDNGQLYQTIDTSVSDNTNYVIGKVTGTSYFLGLILSFLMNPIGIVLLIILPCFFIMLFEVIKIVRVVMADKRNLELEEKNKKEQELEELRRRLAELEKQSSTAAVAEKNNKKEGDNQ